ncbi:type III-A CRISPR-associated RAMP protein Csm5 [Tuanshanicoccus lijuaniae]
MTFAPVHIGSGEELTNKDYIDEGNVFFVPAMENIIEELIKKEPNIINTFESLLYKINNNNNNTLEQLLKLFNVDIKKMKGYRISKGKDTKTNKTGKIEIRPFIRNGLNQLYIPGSTIKGVLRTILEDQFDSFGEKITQEKNKEKINDIFRNIRIMDSDPIPENSFMLARKIDFVGDNPINNNDYNKWNIYRESIEPGTEIYVTVICTSYSAIKFMDQIHELTKKQNMNYYEMFLKYKPEILRQKKTLGYMLYLGGGTGICTKTRIKNPGSSKASNEYALKLTKAQPIKKFLNPGNKEGYYEMGLCYFDIKGVR